MCDCYRCAGHSLQHYTRECRGKSLPYAIHLQWCNAHHDALGAGLYLLWIRWRSLKDRERRERLQKQKDHLDKFLKETLQIELAQMETSDPKKLLGLLDQVTRVKHRALKELTEEELRGDRSFSIFLMQCSNLSNKIQFRMLNHDSP